MTPLPTGGSRVYVSFDVDHDGELYERLIAQSDCSGFSVSGSSERLSAAETWQGRVRNRIRDAEQVIVICGEYTGDSRCMSEELRIAHEERTPYFLLWGRRETMCTKPSGAKSADGIYSWTKEILEDQIAIGVRRARALANALRKP